MLDGKGKSLDGAASPLAALPPDGTALPDHSRWSANAEADVYGRAAGGASSWKYCYQFAGKWPISFSRLVVQAAAPLIPPTAAAPLAKAKPIRGPWPSPRRVAAQGEAQIKYIRSRQGRKTDRAPPGLQMTDERLARRRKGAGEASSDWFCAIRCRSFASSPHVRCVRDTEVPGSLPSVFTGT